MRCKLLRRLRRRQASHLWLLLLWVLLQLEAKTFIFSFVFQFYICFPLFAGGISIKSQFFWNPDRSFNLCRRSSQKLCQRSPFCFTFLLYFLPPHRAEYLHLLYRCSFEILTTFLFFLKKVYRYLRWFPKSFPIPFSCSFVLYFLRPMRSIFTH